MSWSKLKLGELTRIRTGKLDANAADEDGIYPFFTCAVEPLLINIPAFDCKAVLVAGNGDLNVKYHEGKFNAYQRTYVIESIDTNKLHPKFLYYFLSDYIVELRELSIGGVIKYIKLGNLTDAKIPLPPIAEQKRIAEILDKANAIKVKRELALAKLDELAQCTFLEMFGDPVIASNKWGFVALGDVCSKITDGTHKTPTYVNNGVEFLSAKDIKLGKIIWNSGKFISLDEHIQLTRRCKPELGDVLLAKSGTLGNAAIVDEEREFSLFESLCLIKLHPQRLNNCFLIYCLKSPTMQERLLSKNKGVGVKHLHLIDIKSLQIPLPSIELQVNFANKAIKIEALKDQILKSLRNEKILISSLENQAFTTGFNA